MYYNNIENIRQVRISGPAEFGRNFIWQKIKKCPAGAEIAMFLTVSVQVMNL